MVKYAKGTPEAERASSFKIHPILAPLIPATRRPKSEADIETDGARRAFEVLAKVEAQLVTRIHEAGDVRRAIAASSDLSPEGKANRIKSTGQSVFKALAVLARWIDSTLVDHLAGTHTGLLNMRKQRDQHRTAAAEARLGQVRDAMLGLSNGQREALLILALQAGDVDVLEAVATWSPVLDSHEGLRLSGTTRNMTDRPTIDAKFLEVIAPDLCRERDEVEAIAAAAATELSFAVAELERQYQQRATEEELNDRRARWQMLKLDTFSETALFKVRSEAQIAGKQEREFLEQRAREYEVADAGNPAPAA